MSNIVPFNNMQAPAHLMTAKSSQDIAAMNAAAALGTGGNSVDRISLKQSRFRIIVGGAEVHVVPVPEIRLVIVRVNEGITKTWFEKQWNPNDDPTEPECSSDDGYKPRADASKPQCGPDGLCQNCPQNQWGSKINPTTGKKVKACSDSKRMAVMWPDANGRYSGGSLYQLSVPAASLGDFGTHVRKLASHHTPTPYNAVETKVFFDLQATYPKIMFEPVRFLESDEWAVIDGLYDDAETRRIAGCADAQSMRSAQGTVQTVPASIAGVSPVAAQPQAQQFQQPAQQAPAQFQQPQAQQFQQPTQQAPAQFQQPQAQQFQQPTQQAPAQFQQPQAQQFQQPAQQAPAQFQQPQAQQFQQPAQQAPAQFQQPQAQQFQQPAQFQQPQAQQFQQPAQQFQQPAQQAPAQFQQPAQQAAPTGPVHPSGREVGKPSPGKKRRTSDEVAEDEAYAAAGGSAPQAQQAPAQFQQPQAQQFQQPVVEAQGFQQPQTQGNPFATAPGVTLEQGGAPVQPSVVGDVDLDAAFAAFDQPL